jgi:hypothetical protein
MDYISFNLNEKNEWERCHSYNPGDLNKLPKFPETATLKYKMGDTFQIRYKYLLRDCIVQGIEIFYTFDFNQKDWTIYYDLKWGTGHNGGYFTFEDIEKMLVPVEFKVI